MAQFRKNKKVTNFLYSKPVLIILGAVAVLFAINIVGIAKKRVETERNKNIALAKVSDLKQKQMTLAADIKRLETPEGKEDAVREKFRVTKEGEGLVVILDDPNEPLVPETPPKKGFWVFLRGLFN